MDVFGLIEAQHREIEHMLDDLSAAPDAGSRDAAMTRLLESALPHMNAEEKLLYPAVMEVEGGEGAVAEAVEEHKAAREVMADLDRIDSRDPRWIGAAKALSALLRQHFASEEKEVFEKARSTLEEARALDMADEFHEVERETIIGHML